MYLPFQVVSSVSLRMAAREEGIQPSLHALCELAQVGLDHS